MEAKDQMSFKDKVHIVLTGPDGKVKDERKVGDETDEEHGVQERAWYKRLMPSRIKRP